MSRRLEIRWWRVFWCRLKSDRIDFEAHLSIPYPWRRRDFAHSGQPEGDRL